MSRGEHILPTTYNYQESICEFLYMAYSSPLYLLDFLNPRLFSLTNLFGQNIVRKCRDI